MRRLRQMRSYSVGAERHDGVIDLLVPAPSHEDTLLAAFVKFIGVYSDERCGF